MLRRLSEHIATCLELAARAEQRAKNASDPEVRADNERLAKSWRHIARTYEFIESLERFLLDIEKTKGTLPPEPPQAK
jgi:hypothetical protein